MRERERERMQVIREICGASHNIQKGLNALIWMKFLFIESKIDTEKIYGNERKRMKRMK